eukprot:6485863-Amphidinium_carterae.2
MEPELWKKRGFVASLSVATCCDGRIAARTYSLRRHALLVTIRVSLVWELMMHRLVCIAS